MNKLLATLAATGFMTLSAFAAEVQGTVEIVDPASRTIAMADGTVYTLDDAVDVTGLAAGATVTLTIDDTTNVVTAVEVEM